MKEQEINNIIARNISDYMTRLDLYQQDVAEALNVSQATVSNWCKGIKMPRMDKIDKLCELFKCRRSDLFLDPEDSEKRLSASGQLHPVKHVSFPIIGSVSCGEPKFAGEDYEGLLDAEEDIDADFCLRAKGDSMINAGIEDGNIVFIKRQQTVQNGEIAVVAIGDEALLKRVYWYPDKQLLILRPENPAYEDILYTAEAAEEIRILGKAVFLQKRIR